MARANLEGSPAHLLRTLSATMAGALIFAMAVPAGATDRTNSRETLATAQVIPLANAAAPNATPSTARCSTSPVRAGANGSFLSVLKQDSSVWAWGDNSQGELGDGTTTNRSTPVQVVGSSGAGLLSGIATVANGSTDTVAGRADGTVQAWGLGPLGDPSQNNSTTPIQVAGPQGNGYLTKVLAVENGNAFFMALRADGTVWTWGDGHEGQLGNGSLGYSGTPVEVVSPSGGGALTGIVQIAAGTDHALALKSDGSVWSWGYDGYGELGINQPNAYHPVPTQVVGAGGTGFLSGIVGISGGYEYSLALKFDGTVWSWGDNLLGELGYGTSDSNRHPFPAQVVGPGGTGFLTTVAQVSATHYVSGAVKTDGTAWTWGYNGVGELGNGDTTLQPSATPVQVVAPGGGFLTGVTRLAGGGGYGVALKTDGSLWAWGSNYFGTLGQGTTDSNAHPTPVQVLGQGGTGKLTGIAQAGPCNAPEAEEIAGGTPIDEKPTTASFGMFPVDAATGNFWHSFTDFAIPGRGLPLLLTRTYNSQNAAINGPLGNGWTHSYNLSLSTIPPGRSLTDPTAKIAVHEETGGSIVFSPDGAGNYVAPSRALGNLTYAGGTFTLARRDQTLLQFNTAGQLAQEVDRNGYVTSLSYSNGQLSTVTDPAGRALTFSYYAKPPMLAGVSDVAGRSVTFKYDGSGNLQSATDVAGNTWTFGYDGNHRLTIMTDPRLGSVANGYDANSRVYYQQDPLNRTTTYNYDTPGTTFITDQKGNVTREDYLNNELVGLTLGYGTPQQTTWMYGYDPASNGISSVRDPAGNFWFNSWDPQGNLLQHGDPKGDQWTYTYDGLNDLKTATDALNVTTTNDYDTSGNLKRSYTPLVGTTQTATTLYSYDPAHAGDLTSVTDADGQVWTYGYDQYGVRNKVVDPVGDTTTYAYDNVGRLRSSVSPLGNAPGGNPGTFTTTYTPDALGRPTYVTDPLSHQTYFHYNGNGNVDAVHDANGHATNYSYDADNELYNVLRADGSTLKTAYDGDGNVVSQTDGAGRATLYTYDPLNRLQSVSDPLNRTTTYQYDPINERVTMTDPQQRVTTYDYDSANRLFRVSYSDGVTPAVFYAYDPDGQRQTMTDGTGTTTYKVDSLHRLFQLTTGAGQVVQFGYDLKGQLTAITYPGGTQTVGRTYDPAGRLKTVSDWNNHTTIYGYDVNSNVKSVTYPSGTVATFGYDNADRLTSIVDAKGASNFLSLTYVPDAIGQATSENSTSYGYNPINQLTGAGNTTYTYDAADNLRQLMMSGLGTATLMYDPANQLSTGSVTNGSSQVETLTFKYDQEGNRYQETGTGALAINNTYGYDQANRLTSFGSGATYAYNGDGLRMSKTLSGATSQQTWDVAEGLPLLLRDGTTSYVTGLSGLPLEQITASGATSYYHQDRLGSTRSITDLSGSVVATDTYDAYGNVTASTGTLANPFKYAGQYTDSESGLQYRQARYYDSTVGSFMSRDPQTAATRLPYAYAANSPINASDPSGLGIVEAGQAVLGGGADLARSGAAVLVSWAGDWVATEHDRLVSGNPLAVTVGVLDVFATVFTIGAGFAPEAAAEEVAAETESREAADLAESCAVNSFSSDTPVLMADGSKKPINQVKVGDRVLTADPQNKVRKAETVARVIVGHGRKQLYDIRVGGAIVEATYNHPFWVVDKHSFVWARDLKPGDHLLLADGMVSPINDISHQNQITTVYNLSIEEIHTFFVGRNSVLVHNMCAMVGEGGTQVTSRTLTINKEFRIDVENPSPGVRPGQLHLQDFAGNKYQYNFETGQFEGLPRSLAERIAGDPAVERAISTGLRYLGIK